MYLAKYKVSRSESYMQKVFLRQQQLFAHAKKQTRSPISAALDVFSVAEDHLYHSRSPLQ